MRYADVVRLFRTERKIAAALGCTRQAVNLWKQAGVVPEGVAYKLHVLTAGRLRVDPRCYERTPDSRAKLASVRT